VNDNTEYKISAPALHAARMILKHFDLIPKGRVEASEHDLAVMIDTATSLHRLIGPIDEVVKTLPALGGALSQTKAAEISKAVAALCTARDWMPSYGQH
jgi:hypothetical protein